MAVVDLLTHLRALPDRRIQKKTRHRLDEMVFIAICAVISGAEGWSDIVAFAETKRDWLRRFLFLDRPSRKYSLRTLPNVAMVITSQLLPKNWSG